MTVEVDGDEEPPPSGEPILVPELRDYHQINAEVRRRLNQGETRVRLEGPAGHRLLLAGLSGSWEAVIEVAGNAGPELASEMDAPGVTVVCRGSSADGAGSGLRAGILVLIGSTGVALGYRQTGGLIVAVNDAGPRAGLSMTAGGLVLFGSIGPLAGERQTGGTILLNGETSANNLGRDARGGRRYRLSTNVSIMNQDDLHMLRLANDLRDRYHTPPAD